MKECCLTVTDHIHLSLDSTDTKTLVLGVCQVFTYAIIANKCSLSDDYRGMNLIMTKGS